MKLKHVAIIATVMVIIAGFAMISPLFFRSNGIEEEKRVMLSFSVSESTGVVEWCRDLSSLLDTYDIGASVFIVGKLATQYPEIVSYFGDKVDIGSQTYSNTKLTSISDYSLKLEEVQQGKAAVDSAGKLSSKLFRAPYGATDQDIYSLLSRSGILADFSYLNQYNIYQDSQFIKHEAVVYDKNDLSPNFFQEISQSTKPLIITFDNTCSISDIESFLSEIEAGHPDFVSASELAGIPLTIRRVNYGNAYSSTN